MFFSFKVLCDKMIKRRDTQKINKITTLFISNSSSSGKTLNVIYRSTISIYK